MAKVLALDNSSGQVREIIIVSNQLFVLARYYNAEGARYTFPSTNLQIAFQLAAGSRTVLPLLGGLYG